MKGKGKKLKRKPILIDFCIEKNKQLKEQISSYECIKHNIYAHVLLKNDLDVSDVVYVELKNVFIVCEIRLNDCRALVSDEIFELWNIPIEKLFDDAMHNTELFDVDTYVDIMLHIFATNQNL